MQPRMKDMQRNKQKKPNFGLIAEITKKNFQKVSVSQIHKGLYDWLKSKRRIQIQ